MLLDAARYHLTEHVERHFREIRREAEALTDADYQPWPDVAAYTGGTWSVFPLLLQSWPDGFETDFHRNRRRMPSTWRLLRRQPGLVSAGLSRLGPGCHIPPHTDLPNPGVVRAHLGVVVPEGAVIRIAGTLYRWQEARVLMFDGQQLHEAGNLTHRHRVVLMLDFVAVAQRIPEAPAAAPAADPQREEFLPDLRAARRRQKPERIRRCWKPVGWRRWPCA